MSTDIDIGVVTHLPMKSSSMAQCYDMHPKNISIAQFDDMPCVFSFISLQVSGEQPNHRGIIKISSADIYINTIH